MSVTICLVIGQNQVLTQNVIYALPARKCLATIDTAATIVTSDTVDFTHTNAITLANGQFNTSGGFIKSTAGDCNIFLAAD